jgi:hypothetical protein
MKKRRKMPCWRCKGTGTIWVKLPRLIVNLSGFDYDSERCPVCRGKRWV